MDLSSRLLSEYWKCRERESDTKKAEWFRQALKARNEWTENLEESHQSWMQSFGSSTESRDAKQLSGMDREWVAMVSLTSPDVITGNTSKLRSSDLAKIQSVCNVSGSKSGRTQELVSELQNAFTVLSTLRSGEAGKEGYGNLHSSTVLTSGETSYLVPQRTIDVLGLEACKREVRMVEATRLYREVSNGSGQDE